MKVSDYDYQLPDELIAQYPPIHRGDSRLLVMKADGAISDHKFSELADYLREGDLLVLNDTKVIPARLFGCKDTGGKLEVLLERINSQDSFIAQVRCSKSPRIGQSISIDGDENAKLTVIGRQGNFFVVGFQSSMPILEWFEQVGHIPLPPYIDRSDRQQDQDRYQTVFAENYGAVAAPTAGLHYNDVLLDTIRAKGVEIGSVTLHVGAGTYQPVKVEQLSEHKMHSEVIQVSDELCALVNATRKRGGRVMAVGTTVVRSLETAAQYSKSRDQAGQLILEPYQGETEIFIYPGFEFKVVDLLQTNFHLPQSTLLMLVSAFAGFEEIKAAYHHAISNSYRFFSYGDAMLLYFKRQAKVER